MAEFAILDPAKEYKTAFEQNAATTPLHKTPGAFYWQGFLSQPDIPRTLFYPDDYTVEQQRQAFKQHVCIINIETSTYCNRSCAYCPVATDPSRKNQHYMDDEVFHPLIHDLKSINYNSTLAFNLYNEPLADDHLFGRIEYARQHLPDAFIMFNSNGDYLSVETLERLNALRVGALFVTLHAPLKRGYHIEDRFKAFRRLFNTLGIDQYTIEGPDDKGSLICHLYYGQMYLKVMANDWEQHGNSRAGNVENLEAAEIRTTPCVRPLREVTISSRGDIFPCCQFYPDDQDNQQYVLGKMNNQSLLDIYFSDQACQWRRHLFTFGEKGGPCKGCRDPDTASPDSASQRQHILSSMVNS